MSGWTLDDPYGHLEAFRRAYPSLSADLDAWVTAFEESPYQVFHTWAPTSGVGMQQGFWYPFPGFVFDIVLDDDPTGELMNVERIPDRIWVAITGQII